MMRAWRAALAAALIFMAVTSSVEAVDPTEMPTPALQERYLELTHELRCMQCQNESIADSPVDLAADLRRQVHDM
jgi:cytochrome c-type biogenesis protein CcmH